MINNAQDRDIATDDRIAMQVVGDCDARSAQMMGWYYYLAENLQFPFTAICCSKRTISPIHQGGKFEVVRMASADECDREIFVEIVWDCDTLAVPLSQLSASAADTKTQLAIAEWHDWIG